MFDLITLVLQTGALFLLITALFLVCVLLYRLFLHPLAKYPGPFLGRISNLYAGYHAWKGDLHLDMWRCHLKYGKTVRYAPNRLMINSDTALHDIYDMKKNLKKSKDYSGMVHMAPNTLTLIDKTEHSRRRRIMSQGFSTTLIRSYETKILKHVRNMCKAIRREDGSNLLNSNMKKEPSLKSGEWSTPIEMSKMSNHFAFDVMADIVFGLDYDLLGSTRWRYVCDCIEASNVRIGAILQAPELTFARLDKWIFPKAIYGRNKFVRFVGGLLRSMGHGNLVKNGTVFSGLASAIDPLTGTGFTPAQIAAESTTLIVAGSDTTSTAVAGMFFYLTRNAYVYNRVTKEIRSAFKSVDDISLGTTLNSCIYLRACIDETMRISPSVGSALWREVKTNGAEIDGMYIPAGCDVGTSIYSIHHHPDYYPDPFKFKPERWLIGEDNVKPEHIKRAQSTFNPFSLGPRGCIGRGLALAEMQLLMAMMIFTFDFKCESNVGEGRLAGELGREKPWEFQLYDHVTAAKAGPIIQFKERVIPS